MRVVRAVAFLLIACATARCGGTSVASTNPDAGQGSTGPTGGGAGTDAGAGGGGGGTQVPPPPSIDGPSWFINNASAVIGTPPSPNVDFGALQNTVQGAIGIGTTRTAQVLVYNTSKKMPLTLTEISIAGPNAGDFSVAPLSVELALNMPIPANRGAAASLQLTFLPAAEGVRTATLRLVSNAGTALVSLTGEGLPARPIIATSAGLTFIPTSAFDTVPVGNQGGLTLVLQSIGLGGANPSSFQFVAANHGFSNCFAGIGLSPHAVCYLGVAVVAGAPAPSSALLVIQSNDPVHPETDIPLALTP
jgi:hypothetical protein